MSRFTFVRDRQKKNSDFSRMNQGFNKANEITTTDFLITILCQMHPKIILNESENIYEFTSILFYTLEYDIIFLSSLFSLHTSTSRPSTYSHDEMKNENNACKVGQSNETDILSTIALGALSGRKKWDKHIVAVFLLCSFCFGFSCCNIFFMVWVGF